MKATQTAAEKFDAIVIGAGIIGCACADRLTQQGLRVLVIESSTVGGGTTAAGMGHLVVMDDNPAELALSAHSLELWRAFAADTQLNRQRNEYLACGTIWVATDEEEMTAASAKQKTLAAHGIASTLMNSRALAEAEPNCRAGLAGGLLVHEDAIVYPPKSAQILLERAISKGAQLLRARVASLVDGGVQLSDGSVCLARETIVANGMASLELVPELPLRYKKGQLVITERYPKFIRHQLVELGYIKSAHASDGDSVAFNLQPRPTGQILIGSSRQFDVTHKEIDLKILSAMLAQAASFVPAIAQLKALRTWTGFRAATPDGLPYIGPHPTREHVWLATGHEGLGITTSLGTADILSNQICGLSSAIGHQAYLPQRAHCTH